MHDELKKHLHKQNFYSPDRWRKQIDFWWVDFQRRLIQMREWIVATRITQFIYFPLDILWTVVDVVRSF